MKDELIKILKQPNFTPFEIDYSFAKRQKIVNINGIDIYFPYDIYSNQSKYMEKIIQLLNDRVNSNIKNIGALESPTGTGKTLCLLCSTLAWVNEMRRQKRFGGKIIYTTRTHSQVTQTIHELRKTCYRPRTAVLSSREHCCVNSNLRKNLTGNILDIICRKNCVKCPYYNGVLSDKRERNNMMDIEELFKNGKLQTFCPYYQQIEIAKSYSDIIFMPYNYIFDEDIYNIMEIDITNDIIIVDEAHNIRKVCEDSKSIEIKSIDFDDIIKDLDSFLNLAENDELIENHVFNFNNKKKNKKKREIIRDIPKDDIAIEKKAIENIQNKFNQFNLKNKIKNGQKIDFFEFFEIFLTKEEYKRNKKNKKKKKVTHKDDELSCDSSISLYFDLSENITATNIDEHIKFLEQIKMNFQEFFEKGTKITIILKILNIIRQLIDNILLRKCYIFYMEEEQKEKMNEETGEKESESNKKFFIFCFNPNLGFSEILRRDPFSIIFTSGTLTPFKLYENELQIKFDITLENEHIVPHEQINFNILSDYENGKFRFDYNNRENIDMVKALGKEIINYCKNVQTGGILVFFPSFYYLNKCWKIWDECGINKMIEIYKKLYLDSSRNKNIVTQMKDDIKKNYIFFSVFRGIASEGIDFSDDSARAVICIGIPFADISDNRVKLKMDYLNSVKKDNPDFIGGNEWYEADAMTAVNQSLGRVIRHKNDFGIMLCVDERYKRYENYFSFWIRDYYEKNKNNDIKISEFLDEQREKFKDIIEKNKQNYIQKKSNQSGFNSTINIDEKLFLGNKTKHKEILYEKNEEDMDIEEDLINNIPSQKEQSKNSIKELQNNNIFNIPEKPVKKINEINIKDIGYKTNYEDILKTINIKKPVEKKEIEKNSELYEEWNSTKKNNKKQVNIFEKEEKQGKELLEELKLFAFNNHKEFNNILDKYKY